MIDEMVDKITNEIDVIVDQFHLSCVYIRFEMGEDHEMVDDQEEEEEEMVKVDHRISSEDMEDSLQKTRNQNKRKKKRGNDDDEDDKDEL